jgi:hypothetical protein
MAVEFQESLNSGKLAAVRQPIGGIMIRELLNHPAVQAGFAPFLVAFVTAELFQRIRLSGLAIIAGFAVTVYLASSFTFAPHTAPQKIALMGLAGAALGLLLSLMRLSWFSALLPLLGGATAVWVVLRILQQQPPQVALLWGAGCAAYVAVLVWSMDMIEHDPVRSASAATALGMGTGTAALVGASALLGQFGLALGSAAAAHLLIQMLSGRTLQTGRVFTLPLALLAGLVGCLGVLSAQLPWYALPILAAIPVSAWLIPLPKQSMRIQIMVLSVMEFAIAGGAIFATWRVAGDVPF